MKKFSSARILAERLQYEFDRKGVTLNQVATHSGISLKAINEYLEENRELSLNEVGSICDAININFFRLISKSYSKSKLHFRNLKEPARKFSSEIEECYLLFNDNLPIPQIPNVQLDDFFDDRIGLIGIIQPIIQQIKAQFGNSIVEVLDNLCIPIISISAPQKEFDAFLINTHPYYAICINENAPPNRIRFSLCHEFSHFLFDRHLSVSVDENTMINLFAKTFSPEERPEFIATKFAQYFLLPFDEIQTICSDWKSWYKTLNYERTQGIIDKNQIGIEVLLNGIRDLCEIHGITIQYNILKDHLASKFKFPSDLSVYKFLHEQKWKIKELLLKNKESYSDDIFENIFKSLKMIDQ